ncbi:MAG: efflux RND transporter periplasmic adaptor subunit [Bacteroidales bacterium]|jgi:RND family efflux transporter MFP subunit
MKSNKWQQWLFVSALLIPFASCSYTQSSNKSVQNPVKVTVYTVFEEKESPERMYVGVVEEANKVLLSFPAPGKVKQVYVSVGQTVNQGQILATLDSETLEQMHASALATLRQAEDAWERLTLLYESGSLPEVQYVDIQTKLEQAKAAEKIAARALAETQLRAPMSGVIGKRAVEEGMNVLPDQPVITLLNTQRPIIKINVPENEIFDTKAGQPARIIVGALKSLETTGKVTEKGVQAHPYTHGYDVKITPDYDIPGLLPGMVCKTYIKNVPEENFLVLPVRALNPEPFKAGHFVWVLDEENRAHKRTVFPGTLVQGGISILEGVKHGDRVIEEGHQRVTENCKVEVVNE